MKAHHLCFFILTAWLAFLPGTVHAQDDDDDLTSPTELDEEAMQDQETEETSPVVVIPAPTEEAQVEEEEIEQTQEEEGTADDNFLLNPFQTQEEEDEAPLELRGQDQEEESEEDVQDEEELTQDQEEEVKEVGRIGEETAQTIPEMEQMTEAEKEALTRREEAKAEEEVEETQNAEGFDDVMKNRVTNGEPGYGTMIPVPTHDDGDVEESSGGDKGKGMHKFWETLLGSVLQGVTDGFQRRYAVAKLNQMKARADRIALAASVGKRPVVDASVRRNVNRAGLNRLTNSDPRLSDLMFGRNRSGSGNGNLRATSGGPTSGGSQVRKIDQYRLATRYDSITGKPMTRSDGVTQIKVVDMKLGARPSTSLRRR